MSFNNDESQSEVVEDFENELCIHCCEANAPLVKFCRHCRAPLHPLAAYNPYERVYATGFIWRTAVSKPNNRMVLIGMYLYFAPTLLVQALLLWGIFRDTPGYRPDFGMFTELVIIGVFLVPAVVSLMILVQTTRNYFK
jgi:hypothetical protein